MFPLYDNVRTNRKPFWVILIILANVIVFFLEITSPNFENFLLQYALIPSLVSLANPLSWLPIITSMFLHGGWLHILSNMWFFWIFGDNVEERLGPIRFPLVYIISGMAGAFAQYIVAPTSDIPMLGASGAVAGIMGAAALG